MEGGCGSCMGSLGVVAHSSRAATTPKLVEAVVQVGEKSGDGKADGDVGKGAACLGAIGGVVECGGVGDGFGRFESGSCVRVRVRRQMDCRHRRVVGREGVHGTAVEAGIGVGLGVVDLKRGPSDGVEGGVEVNVDRKEGAVLIVGVAVELSDDVSTKVR